MRVLILNCDPLRPFTDGHKHKKSLRRKLDSLSKEKSRDKGNMRCAGYSLFSRGGMLALPPANCLQIKKKKFMTLSDIFVILFPKPVKINNCYLGL